MALAGRNRRPITAAAQKIGFSQVTAEKLRDQPWQERAWDVYDKLGPIYYMTRYRSAVARKVDYFAARKDSPGTDPDNDVTLDEEGDIAQLGPATKVLEAEGGPELIRRIVSELMVHWDVAGEAYLVRFEEGPFWRVLSTQELKSKKGNYLWEQAPPGMGEIDGDNVYRVWKPHPRQHWQADSPTRHVLEDAEGLILSSREIRARSMSRLSAGILLLPDSLDLSPFADDTEGTEDDVARWLTNILAGPVKDPGSTQGIAPSVMTMNGADIALVRHMTFDREWDVSIELREEQLNHVALGIDMPPELATGTAGSMNHWGSWWLTDEAVNMHVLPTVDDILDSLSINWFRPLLEAASVDPETYVIWRDPSAATVPTDRSDVALKMFELGAISGEALRRVTDFDEEDAPGEDDVVPGESASPEGVPQDGPPPPPVQGSFDALVAAVLERLKEGGPPLADAAVTAATRRRIVATELADIDAEILAWVVQEADLEIDRILKGVGIQAATDPLDESLLARFGQRVEAQIAKAQERARSWVERLTGRRVPDEGESEARSAGLQVILAGVLEAVRRRLFTPQGGPDPIDTGKIADILPPTTAIREGLSLAGGGPAVYEDGHTSELIGNGQFIQDELRQDGFVPELMVWRHGGPAHPFEPHRSLNGTEFDSWDSPKLTATERWGRIGEYYKPDDHDGCTCTVEMVLVEMAPDIGEGPGEIFDTVGGEGNISTDGMSPDEAQAFLTARRRMMERYPEAASRVRTWGTGQDAPTRARFRQVLVEDRARRTKLYGADHAQVRKLDQAISDLDMGLRFETSYQSAYGEIINGLNIRNPDGTSHIIVRPGLRNNPLTDARKVGGTGLGQTEYTATHEFGHSVEWDWTSRLADRTPLSAVTEGGDIRFPGRDPLHGFRTIQDAIVRLGASTDVSVYGRTNIVEGFAETFVAHETGVSGGAAFGRLVELVDMAESWPTWAARTDGVMSLAEWQVRLNGIGRTVPPGASFRPPK